MKKKINETKLTCMHNSLNHTRPGLAGAMSTQTYHGFFSPEVATKTGFLVYLNPRGTASKVTSIATDMSPAANDCAAYVGQVLPQLLESFKVQECGATKYFITPDGITQCVDNQDVECIERIRSFHKDSKRILGILLTRAAGAFQARLVRFLTQEGASSARADPNAAAPGENPPMWHVIDRYCDTPDPTAQCETVAALLGGRAYVDRMAGTTSFSPLTLAAYRNNSAVARLLLESRADANKPDRALRTATSSVIPVYNTRTVEIIELLLQHRADLNLDAGAGTALHNAAGSDSPALVNLLVRKRADPNQRRVSSPDRGWTPLHLAANNEGWVQRRLGTVAVLLEKNADPFIENFEGATPLDVSVHGPAEEYHPFVDHGDVQHPGVATETIIDWMVDRGRTEFQTRRSPSDGKTVLDRALEWGYFWLVKYLIEKGAKCTSLPDLESGHSLARGAIAYLVHKNQKKRGKRILAWTIPGFPKPVVDLCAMYAWPVPDWEETKEMLKVT